MLDDHNKYPVSFRYSVDKRQAIVVFRTSVLLYLTGDCHYQLAWHARGLFCSTFLSCLIPLDQVTVMSERRLVLSGVISRLLSKP